MEQARRHIKRWKDYAEKMYFSYLAADVYINDPFWLEQQPSSGIVITLEK